METIYHSVMDSPIGKLRVGATGKGLAMLSFYRDEFPPASLKHLRKMEWKESAEHTRKYTRQLAEYFKGKRRDFDLPLDLRGTEFQKKCWNALIKIPYGKTRSYGDIARKVGSPKGFRAVGMANNRNPVAIIVPCHRVIAAQGKLGGYGGGLKTKEWLLRLEGNEEWDGAGSA